jgi:uncharacterized membrane protein YeaQ/YmgE (transglycosylase-associated protein family)
METWMWFIAIGLVAGGLASALVPGRTLAGAIGAVITAGLGSALGYWVFDYFGASSTLTWIGSAAVAAVGAGGILIAAREVGDSDRTHHLPA